MRDVPVWQAVVLMDLALAVGVGTGYLIGNREAGRLGAELEAVQAASIAPAVVREWQVRGVIRAVLPEVDVLVITHEAIPGYMPPMTMGFRTASPTIREAVEVGDAVRFTLRGAPPNVVLIAIEKTEP